MNFGEKIEIEYFGNAKPLKTFLYKGVFCARNRNRTDTSVAGNRILSPARLPVPPHGLLFIQFMEFVHTFQCNSGNKQKPSRRGLLETVNILLRIISAMTFSLCQ